jgi:hypothetical protein
MCLTLSELRARVEKDEPIHPSEITNRWDGWNADGTYSLSETKHRMVIVDDIVGTAPHNVDRLNKTRLIKVLNKIIENNWKPKQDAVSLEQHPNGKLYVGADGNHRVLAHKLLNIDQIYAKIAVYKQG